MTYTNGAAVLGELVPGEPLIYTSKGNVPIDSLTYTKDWKVDESFVIFREFWHDSDGNIVKNNVHMFALQGLAVMGGAQATM
jgi:hypothetical protein